MRVLASPGPSQWKDGNPYIRLLYGSVAHAAVGDSDITIDEFTRRTLLERPDVVHVNWPYYLVRWARLRHAVPDVAKVLLLIALARRRGAALIWTVHDLQPHEVARPWLWRAFFRGFVAQVDLVVLLSAGSHAQVVAAHPRLAGKPYRVVPHGHYRDEYASLSSQHELSRHEARAQLGLVDRPTLLAFGQIRPYKRTVELCRAFAALPETARECQLLVAGEVRTPALQAQLESVDDPGIRLMLGSVPHEQVPAVFGACDVVVLPYSTHSALNSGVALLALSFGRPVVMVETAAGRDLQALVGPEWLTLAGDQVDEVLAAARERARQAPETPLDLSALEWPAIGERLVSAYHEAVLAH